MRGGYPHCILFEIGYFVDISGIDVLDNTPLIDIKPYVPKFDHFDNANNGWAETKKIGPKPKARE